MQFIGYFLNALLGGFQQGFRLQNHEAVNPIARRPFRSPLSPR